MAPGEAQINMLQDSLPAVQSEAIDRQLPPKSVLAFEDNLKLKNLQRLSETNVDDSKLSPSARERQKMREKHGR